jgi:ABC-type multidrug transport system fused ATPase/permease subunit
LQLLGTTDQASSVAKNILMDKFIADLILVVGVQLGKSTLAKILLRILDFDQGDLLVNGVDIRRLSPAEYHRHVTTVFQGFSKFNSTVRENVGLGYVQKLQSQAAVSRALGLGGADTFVDTLPNGLKTKLDGSGFDSMPSTSYLGCGMSSRQHGLSGGEVRLLCSIRYHEHSTDSILRQWQRIAISRAFMRADRPEVDLLLFDEPVSSMSTTFHVVMVCVAQSIRQTSSLDGLAQNKVFDTIDQVSRSPSGNKTKTVVFITHRLSTARRADKIAMMEQGVRGATAFRSLADFNDRFVGVQTITEFGTHEELIKKGGSYAALYKASV